MRYCYQSQRWVEDDNANVAAQDQKDRNWWQSINEDEKHRFAQFTAQRGDNPADVVRTLDRLWG